MTFLDMLRQDCKDFEIVRMAHARATEAAPLHARGSPALYSVRQVVMSFGVLVAVCGTLANLLQRDELDALEAPSLFKCFIPRHEMALRQFATRGSADEQALAFALGEADNRIMFACRVTESWLRASEGNVSLFVEASVLADVWQRSCAAILEADQLFDALGADTPHLSRNSVAGKTRVALAEVVDGGAPFVDQSGMLSVPGWAERRASERRSCDFDATISAGARAIKCKVVNISLSGYRIAQMSRVLPSGDLTLNIRNRVLEGSLVWQRDGCIGVKWHKRLDANDDLLAEAAATQIGDHFHANVVRNGTEVAARPPPVAMPLSATAPSGPSRLSTFTPRVPLAARARDHEAVANCPVTDRPESAGNDIKIIGF